LVKFDAETIGYITLFEKLTKAKIKDCFIDNNGVLVFIVQEGFIARALGKQGATARQVTEKFKRKLKIAEYSGDVIKFIKNLILPYSVDTITLEDGIVVLSSEDMRTKGLLIGKNGKNLRNYEGIVQRYFEIKEIKVK
jgi:transcription termination/antitermination protein NusA